MPLNSSSDLCVRSNLITLNCSLVSAFVTLPFVRSGGPVGLPLQAAELG